MALTNSPESWKGPGVLFTFFKPLSSSKLSQETIIQWFDEEYIPSLLSTGATTSATLYKAAKATYNKQNLIVQPVPDLAVVKDALSKAPRTSKKSLFEGSVDDHVELETRVYTLTQHYEPTKHAEGPAPTLLTAIIQPAADSASDFDAWYRQEHNAQMSELPGYLRTMRYNLVQQTSNAAEKSTELPFLAVHEFGKGEDLGEDVKPPEPISDWTKKVMGSAQEIDCAIYRRVGE